MLPDYDEATMVSYQASARDAELWLPVVARLDCRYCEKRRWNAALSYTTKLNHLDEPVVISGAESYRMVLRYFYTLAMVRIEHSEGRSELMVKVARGASDWRPAVQTIRRRSRALSESEWQRVSQAVQEYGFWDQPVMSPSVGKLAIFEALNVSLEGVDSEQRHVIWRTSSDSNEKFLEVVDLFWELADCNPDEEND